MRYVAAILSLGLLIVLHELGHLVFARAFGIRIEQLSIGMGPVLFSARRGGTEFALKAIPIGASLQIRGMNPHALSFDRADPTSFASKGTWKKALVIAGGPLANLVLALGLLVSLYARGTHVPVPMTVGTVAPGSEAARALLRPGDQIIALEGNPVDQWAVLVDAIADNPGKALQLTVIRQGRSFELSVRPRPDERGAGRIGIAQQYVYREHRVREAALKALGHLRRLFFEGTHSVRRLARENVGADMVQQFSDASVSGLDSFLRALVSLSLALAAFYLLPLPPLDGGRLALLAIETARGRPINPKMDSLIGALGMLALVATVGWLLARDGARLVIASFEPRAAPSLEAMVPPSPRDAGVTPADVSSIEPPDEGAR